MKVVKAVNLGDVYLLRAEQKIVRTSLMAGHMKRHDTSLVVFFEKFRKTFFVLRLLVRRAEMHVFVQKLSVFAFHNSIIAQLCKIAMEISVYPCYNRY